MVKRKNSDAVKAVKKFLKNGGSKTRLATFMGYTCTETIDQWIRRGNVPAYAAKRVVEYTSKRP